MTQYLRPDNHGEIMWTDDGIDPIAVSGVPDSPEK